MATYEGAGIPPVPEGYHTQNADAAAGHAGGERPPMTRGDVPVLLLALAFSLLWTWASDAAQYSLWFLFSGGATLSVGVVSLLACAIIVRRGLMNITRQSVHDSMSRRCAVP